MRLNWAFKQFNLTLPGFMFLSEHQIHNTLTDLHYNALFITRFLIFS